MDAELIKILVCPKCKGKIELDTAGTGLECWTCRLIYPIKDGIPVMLVDEAVELKK